MAAEFFVESARAEILRQHATHSGASGALGSKEGMTWLFRVSWGV